MRPCWLAQEERLEAEHRSSTSYSDAGPPAPGAPINLNISGEEAFARRARHALEMACMFTDALPYPCGSRPAPAHEWYDNEWFVRVYRMSRGPSGFSAGPGPGQGAPADDPKGMTLAAKMMEKMGWKVMLCI